MEIFVAWSFVAVVAESILVFKHYCYQHHSYQYLVLVMVLVMGALEEYLQGVCELERSHCSIYHLSFVWTHFSFALISGWLDGIVCFEVWSF